MVALLCIGRISDVSKKKNGWHSSRFGPVVDATLRRCPGAQRRAQKRLFYYAHSALFAPPELCRIQSIGRRLDIDNASMEIIAVKAEPYLHRWKLLLSKRSHVSNLIK